jgi:hypothetical protein
MKPSKLYEALHALIGERVPLHIWGACGVGKSQIVAQVARDPWLTPQRLRQAARHDSTVARCRLQWRRELSLHCEMNRE